MLLYFMRHLAMSSHARIAGYVRCRAAACARGARYSPLSSLTLQFPYLPTLSIFVPHFQSSPPVVRGRVSSPHHTVPSPFLHHHPLRYTLSIIMRHSAMSSHECTAGCVWGCEWSNPGLEQGLELCVGAKGGLEGRAVLVDVLSLLLFLLPLPLTLPIFISICHRHLRSDRTAAKPWVLLLKKL